MFVCNISTFLINFEILWYKRLFLFFLKMQIIFLLNFSVILS